MIPSRSTLILPSSPLLRSTVAGIAGFAVYGTWAVYVNASHGMAVAMRSGLVQGTYSFILTLLVTLMTEWLFSKIGSMRFGPAVTVGIVCSMLFATAYAIHMLVSTPEILMTILPGFVIGSLYTSAYVLGLRRRVYSVEGGRL